MQSVKSAGHQGGTDSITANFTASNGETVYTIGLSALHAYFPQFWKTIDNQGYTTNQECSQFHEYNIHGSKFVFPSQIVQIVHNKSGAITLQSITSISSIIPLTTSADDKSDFQIPSSSAVSIYDQDLKLFIK